ncbi:MAG: DUF4317 family protein [Clostridium sp.]|nr:DUF4317 family protein [Clostridium sp.]
MIHREDMLELTRRMTPARSCISRIAGAYFDEEGYVDGTFNTNFLRLSASERTKQLALAKTVPFADTNVQLKDCRIPEASRRPGRLWQLLDGICQSEMKNDGLLDLLYEVIGEQYQPGYPYACFLFYGRYDVPAKAGDKEQLEDSEELYEYLIFTVSPLAGEYEPGKAEFGFLYPAFRDRSGDRDYVNVFESTPERPHRELTEWLLKG